MRKCNFLIWLLFERRNYDQKEKEVKVIVKVTSTKVEHLHFVVKIFKILEENN